MDKPKCKVCGVRHSAWEPHDLGKPEKAPSIKATPVIRKNVAVIRKDSTNAQRQQKWMESHREEFNR